MSGLATIPKTAPFAEDEIDLLNRVVGPANAIQRAWLAGFLAGVESVTGQAQPAAPARPAEPITIVYASESGNCEKLAGDFAKAARKNGLKPALIDMADLEPADLDESKALGVHRRHLGRGRAAGARRAHLWRADGRGRPASRRRRIRRAGARRYRLCGILCHRQTHRRAAGRARRQARGRARRLRSRFRCACVGLDRRRAESSHPARCRPRPRKRPSDRGRFRQGAGCAEHRHRRGRNQRAHQPQFLALRQGNHPSRARLRRRGAGLRAGRLARSLCRERSGLCRRVAAARRACRRRRLADRTHQVARRDDAVAQDAGNLCGADRPPIRQGADRRRRRRKNGSPAAS